MIAFATLILGLFLGPKPVELVVGDGVAAVELRLDGERVGVLTEPPWVMEVDFGELAPRHLEAIALDAADRELGRASQWLNLPQPEAVLSAAFEPRTPGAGRVVRLSWESIAGAEPESVTASLDGRPIAVADPRRIELPAVDESQLHLLSVELVFNDLVSSRVDLTFGGAYADEVSTEMTALPLYATGKVKRPPTVADVQGWFVKDGEPLPVIVVEKGTAEIVVVMGRPFPHLVDPTTGRYKPPKGLKLADDHRLRFVSPIAEQKAGVATTFELFPTSPAYDGRMGDLYRMLTGLIRLPEKREPRVASAVAVAGLAAYRGRQRRAVVLLPSPDPERDEITPVQARRYLEHLRVPFVVWEPENRPSPAAAWGTARPVGDLKRLAAAYEELTEELDRQWIVWLDGRHLPQDVTLSPEAEGFVLR